ncbi:MAG: TraR/DksA family transcriptional regulator [Bdellovibrionales bacterium]|nr:TraR/DksA family transcriptional regulator [Bdellovibrionales bacterium]
MSTLSPELIEECKQKLLDAKSEVLNRVKSSRTDIVSDDKGGDEGDQTVRALQESEFLRQNARLRNQLAEIEMALARIANGSYGICEETEEPIEEDRLKAIPWTRLSIEGAEIRESVDKRFAR